MVTPLLHTNLMETYQNNKYINYRWRTHKCLDLNCIATEANKCVNWCGEQYKHRKENKCLNWYFDERECKSECIDSIGKYANKLFDTNQNMWNSYGTNFNSILLF